MSTSDLRGIALLRAAVMRDRWLPLRAHDTGSSIKLVAARGGWTFATFRYDSYDERLALIALVDLAGGAVIEWDGRPTLIEVSAP